MRERTVRCAVTLFLGCLLSAGARGQLDDATNNHTLRGLQAAVLTVRLFSDDGEVTKVDGLTQLQIQTDTELRLRNVGIRIVPKKEHDIAVGWLLVDIGVMRVRDVDLYACSMKVRLQQPVTLLRDSSIKTFATTWSTGGVAVVGTSDLRRAREVLGDYVDQFVNGYLAANPR